MSGWEVRRGVTRTVLLTRRWAIKVPSLRRYSKGPRGLLWSMTRGVQANLSELEWSGMDGVCPVRWTLAGLVNVYPRLPAVDPSTEVDYEAIGHIGPADRKPQNLGWLDGRLVYVDYDYSWNDCPHSLNLQRVGLDDESPDPDHDPLEDVPGLFGPDSGMETISYG